MNPAARPLDGGPRNLQSSSSGISAKSVQASSPLSNPGAAQLPQRKRPHRAILLDSVKDELWYRWRYRRTPEKKLAQVFGVTRETVEEVLREKIAGEPTRPSSVIPFPERRAA